MSMLRRSTQRSVPRLNQLDIPDDRYGSGPHPVAPRLFEAPHPKPQRVELSLSCVLSELINGSAVPTNL
jgi:hypothetical protein